MAGVMGKSDTEARSPAVSMISETLARSGPGESLGGQVILGPHHARGESYRTSASHNFTGQRNALSGSALRGATLSGSRLRARAVDLACRRRAARRDRRRGDPHPQRARSVRGAGAGDRQDPRRHRVDARRLARVNYLTSGAPSIPDEACDLFPFTTGQSAYDARVEVSPL